MTSVLAEKPADGEKSNNVPDDNEPFDAPEEAETEAADGQDGAALRLAMK